MGEANGEAGEVAVPFLADPESWALMIVTSLNVGPGRFGPADEWTFPTEPLDETGEPNDAFAEPAQEGVRVSLLHRLTRKR